MSLASGPGNGGGYDLPGELHLVVDKHIAYIQSLDSVRESPTTSRLWSHSWADMSQSVAQRWARILADWTSSSQWHILGLDRMPSPWQTRCSCTGGSPELCSGLSTQFWWFWCSSWTRCAYLVYCLRSTNTSHARCRRWAGLSNRRWKTSSGKM